MAEQLAYYVHVSETVIAEETFDAAVQLAQCGATPPRAEQDDLFACPLGCLQGKEHQGQLTPPTRTAASSASQVGTSVEAKETAHRQMTLN